MPPFFIPTAPLIVLPGATTHINCGWNGNTKNSHFRKSEKLSISTGCSGNETGITFRINFSVALCIRVGKVSSQQLDNRL
ncbi:hypothetical protein, partial [Escherichia coli]|uniref:hypothetical protein n=1 Tax=Escherichia coli TaxID=562 RepID=UPI001BFD6429